MRKKHTFADIAAKRKRYNPETEGYGNPRQWRGNFYERMGFEEAERIMEEEASTPRQVVGVSLAAGWDEIVRAYRKKAMACHPDRAMINHMTHEAATKAFQRLQAAFSVLAHQFGK